MIANPSPSNSPTWKRLKRDLREWVSNIAQGTQRFVLFDVKPFVGLKTSDGNKKNRTIKTHVNLSFLFILRSRVRSFKPRWKKKTAIPQKKTCVPRWWCPRTLYHNLVMSEKSGFFFGFCFPHTSLRSPGRSQHSKRLGLRISNGGSVGRHRKFWWNTDHGETWSSKCHPYLQAMERPFGRGTPVRGVTSHGHQPLTNRDDTGFTRVYIQ